MEKSTNKAKTLPLLIALIVFSVLLAGGYMVYLKYFKETRDLTPPTLQLQGNTYQGFMKDQGSGFLQFDETDVSSYTPPAGITGVALEKGIHFFYATKDITINEIRSSIKPIANAKILIVYYLPRLNQFYAYPKGPYANTREIVDTATFIPKYQGFIIISTQPTEIFNSSIKNEKMLADIPGGEGNNFVKNFVEETEFQTTQNEAKGIGADREGWVLFPSSINPAYLNNYIRNEDPIRSKRIKSVWVQDGENSFKNMSIGSVAADINIMPQNNYSMVWLYLSEFQAPAAGPAAPDPSRDHIYTIEENKLKVLFNTGGEPQVYNLIFPQEELTLAPTTVGADNYIKVSKGTEGQAGYKWGIFEFDRTDKHFKVDAMNIPDDQRLFSTPDAPGGPYTCALSENNTITIALGEPPVAPAADVAFRSMLNNLADGKIAEINENLPAESVRKLEELQTNVNEWSNSLVNKIDSIATNSQFKVMTDGFRGFLNELITIDSNKQMQYLILVTLLNPGNPMDKEVVLAALKNADVQITQPSNQITKTLFINTTVGGEQFSRTLTMTKNGTYWVPDQLKSNNINTEVSYDVSDNSATREELEYILAFYRSHIATYYNKIISMQSFILSITTNNVRSQTIIMPPDMEKVGPFINEMTGNQYAPFHEGKDLIILIQGTAADRNITMYVYNINVTQSAGDQPEAVPEDEEPVQCLGGYFECTECFKNLDTETIRCNTCNQCNVENENLGESRTDLNDATNCTGCASCQSFREYILAEDQSEGCNYCEQCQR